ncbi:NUDIX domain-containing protein [Streptomyces sp. B6B3]|uniref:NUDIX domain-containing protein n=1 Tax=Streptomyces sp. B6B3 TaxID=3153570 RepID=UPI00325C735D
MPVYYLVYQRVDAGARILLARKNIYYGGNRHPYFRPHEWPVPLNNAGQIVIPGGNPPQGFFGVQGARREFREEVGINFDDDQVRGWDCVGDEWRYSPGNFVTYYQRVEDVADLVARGNAAIGAHGLRVHAELLHVFAVDSAQPGFGRTAPQLQGDLAAQYNDLGAWHQHHPHPPLNAPPKAADPQKWAGDRMADDPGWYTSSVQYFNQHLDQHP